MSPRLAIEVRNATYNQQTRELFVEVVQAFHIFLSPLPPAQSRCVRPHSLPLHRPCTQLIFNASARNARATARLIVHLVLKPSPTNDKLLQIALHEDFYHPTDLVALVLPPLVPLVRVLQKFGTFSSAVNARVFGFFGETFVFVFVLGCFGAVRCVG